MAPSPTMQPVVEDDVPKSKPPPRSSLDTLSQKERSARMALVRNKGSKAEMAVRRMIHGLGYRYRLHAKELPGRPDIVFRPRKKAIFVHGCFWHRHSGCPRARFPISPETAQFWKDKLLGNARRDRRNVAALKSQGWDVNLPGLTGGSIP